MESGNIRLPHIACQEKKSKIFKTFITLVSSTHAKIIWLYFCFLLPFLLKQKVDRLDYHQAVATSFMKWIPISAVALSTEQPLQIAQNVDTKHKSKSKSKKKKVRVYSLLKIHTK